jgi:hypothetical protein
MAKLSRIPPGWNDRPPQEAPSPDSGLGTAGGLLDGWQQPGWSLENSGLGLLLHPETITQIDFGDKGDPGQAPASIADRLARERTQHFLSENGSSTNGHFQIAQAGGPLPFYMRVRETMTGNPVSVLTDLGHQAVSQVGDAYDSVMGTKNDPSPIRLGVEWLTGTGPEHRNLDENSRFSKQFGAGPYGKAAETFLLNKIAKGGPSSFDNLDYKYTIPRALNSNLAQQFVGSVQDGTGYAKDGMAHFKVYNESGTKSLFYGTALKEMGSPIIMPNHSRSGYFAPTSTTSQTIQWSVPVNKLGKH